MTQATHSFITTFQVPSHGGIRVCKKKDRTELLRVLQRMSEARLEKSLSQVLEMVIEKQFSNNPIKVGLVKQNIPKYINKDAGIGLKMIIDVLEMLNVSYSYSITAGKKATLLIYEE